MFFAPPDDEEDADGLGGDAKFRSSRSSILIVGQADVESLKGMFGSAEERPPDGLAARQALLVYTDAVRGALDAREGAKVAVSSYV